MLLSGVEYMVMFTSSRSKLFCFVSFLSIFGYNALQFQSLDQDVGPVVFVNILYRHGERTIIKASPTDPFKDPKYWPLGWGQLTKAGIHHHYLLGNWLGERYDHLLPLHRTYNRKAIHVQSTDVDRTLMSAESNLAGMFPTTPDANGIGPNWQPVPIHTVPDVLDKVLLMKHPCKRYDYERDKFLKSSEYLALLKGYKFIGDYCAKMSGFTFDSFTIFQDLYSNFLIEKLNNYQLPDWVSTVYPDKLVAPAGLSFAIPTWTRPMKRLRSGPLLKEMLNNMKSKVSSSSSPSLNISVYSAHDTTIGEFLNSIDLFNMLPPPFASLVLIELRKTAKNDHVITILYKNTTDPDGIPNVLAIPGCPEPCPIEEVEKLWSPIIPDDWDAECHQHEMFDLTSDQPYNTIAIFAMLTCTLIVFLLLALTSLYWTKQKPNHVYEKLRDGTL